MSKTHFIALGVALFCVLPIVGTFGVTDTGEPTARLSAPAQVQSTTLTN
jgi:hypothetical protein